jgi:periplasmic divalent cation tolerance protein
MLHMADALELHVTAPDAEVAERLGRALVEEGLAACVNVVPGVRSIYKWQGKINTDAEVLCLIKTRPALLERVRTRILELHPYEVPEVLAFAVDDGSPAYLTWLRESTPGSST